MPDPENHDPRADERFARLLHDMQRADSPPPDMPGYRVLEEVGAGGFGIVHRAWDEKLEREVALKFLQAPPSVDPRAAERFLQEARALARVRHPNVLTLYGVLEHGETRALSTEFIDGQPLDRILEADGPLPIEPAVRIAIDICRALTAVHEAGIVHRDVKASNVLLQRGGRVVLADFGLGVFAALPDGTAPSASVAGAPLYMSPEQLRGSGVDRRSDIYSLGILLYHLVSGRFPFAHANLNELTSAILAGEAAPLELPGEMGVRLAAVVSRAIDPDPSRRYDSAAALIAALESILRDLQGGRRAARVVALVFVPLIIAGGLALSFLGDPGASNALHVSAVAYLRDGDRRSPFSDGGVRGEGVAVELEITADAPSHFYLLFEDRRGRLYVLIPRDHAEAGRMLAPGKSQVFGDMKKIEPWSTFEAGDSLIALVSTQPIGSILDSLPPGGGTEVTGKEGYPRLKPVAVRGLLRQLTEGQVLPAMNLEERSEDGAAPRLAQRIPDFASSAARAPALGGIWAARITSR